MGKKRKRNGISPRIEEFLTCPNCHNALCRKEAIGYMKNLNFCPKCGAYLKEYKQ